MQEDKTAIDTIPISTLKLLLTFIAPLFLLVVEVGAELVVVLVDDVAPLGLLLSSSARGVMARPDITRPLLPCTCCVTLVEVTVTSFPTGAGLIPLSMRACAPGGTAGIEKLFAKPWFVIRDEAQVRATTLVFSALTP